MKSKRCLISWFYDIFYNKFSYVIIVILRTKRLMTIWLWFIKCIWNKSFSNLVYVWQNKNYRLKEENNLFSHLTLICNVHYAIARNKVYWKDGNTVNALKKETYENMHNLKFNLKNINVNFDCCKTCFWTFPWSLFICTKTLMCLAAWEFMNSYQWGTKWN